MPPYQVFCYTKDCKNPAKYKIAARWSDGVVSELKTYGLCCEECVGPWFSRGQMRFEASGLTAGETLEPPGIYNLERGLRDQNLVRLKELEQKLAAQT